MANVQFIDFENADGSVTAYAVIDRGNGEFTSMAKILWDELEAQREPSGTL